jgi:acyl carrier protein
VGVRRSAVDETIEVIKSFILEEFLPGESPDQLTESTPLVTGGILDSLATLKLVTFLEEKFQIEVLPHEVDTENLDTLAHIAKLVESKR